MSRSFKLPIYKDRGRYKKKYWKWVRSSINNVLRSQLCNDLDNLELPNPKTIVNDWDYSDYSFAYHNTLIKRRFKGLRKRFRKGLRVVNYDKDIEYLLRK